MVNTSVTEYDITYRTPYQETEMETESSSLLPQSERFDRVKRGMMSAGALLLLSAGVFLKVENIVDHRHDWRINTLADLIMGVATALLAQVALAEETKRVIFSEVKKWCVPLFEIGTNVYLNVNVQPQSLLAPQLYFTPVNIATAALTCDDLLLLATMRQSPLQESHESDEPLPMLEGDAKSLSRSLLNQGAILTMGIALILFGTFFHATDERSNIRNVGVAASGYALGTMLAHRLRARVDDLGREWEAAKNQQPLARIPQPLELRFLNGSLRFFQMACPQAFAMSIVLSNNPAVYGLSGLFWGATNQISRTNFQYNVSRADVGEDHGILEKIKTVWTSRKKDIIFTGLWFLVLTGWTIFGEDVAGAARPDEAIATLFGTALGGFLINSLIDLLWRPSDSACLNSLFYNAVALSPMAFAYLFIQKKLVPNDAYVDNSSALGFAAALAAITALGLAIGEERWSQLRERRLFSTPLARALLSYETGLSFQGRVLPNS